MDQKQFRNMTQEEFDDLYNKVVNYIKKCQEKGNFLLYQIVCMDMDLTHSQLKVIGQLHPDNIIFYDAEKRENCRVKYVCPIIPFDDNDLNLEIIDD